MEELLARAKKVAEEAEVFLASSEQTHVQFETNRLKHIQSKQSRHVALRIVRQGRIGYVSATELGDNRQEMVDMAVESAEFGMVARFQLPALTSYPAIDIFDPAVESVSIAQMTGLGEEMVSAVTGHTADIMCEAWVTRAVVSLNLINSRGGQADYRKSLFSLDIEGSLIRSTDMLFVGESESSCRPVLRTEEVSAAVLWQLDMAKNQASVASGSLPVVFTPMGVASALMPSLMVAFNGKTVLQGASPVGSRLGQLIFDEKLSLWDDATVPYRPGSRPCDDEGVPCQRTGLIEEGRVAHFFYDLQTAALADTSSTGNGNRNQGGLPVTAPNAFVIASGDTSFAEMVGDMKEGLIVEQLMGASQGNVLGGDFSGNVLLGYKVENGKVVGRVKNTMVAGNIYQVLKQMAAVGSDSKWVGGMISTPSLYCLGVSMASNG
ncbi:TldD/PmbA family protein [Chloroflexota bacterium]